MAMDAGLDTGAMLLKREMVIGDRNAAQVTAELAELGAGMMVEVVAAGLFEGEAQPEAGITYAAKISKHEARIDWTRGAAQVARQIQGLAPFPGAWFAIGNERIKLLGADVVAASGLPGEVLEGMTIACGDGAIRPTLLQRAGKSPMALGEFLRGFAIPAGSRLV